MDGGAFSPETTAEEKAKKLQSLATGPLSASLARVSASSRALPSDKDFHFLNSFSEFKDPVRDIAGKSEFLLNSVGSSSHLVLGGKPLPHFPAGADPEDSADWLEGVNDEIFERVDASLDEFRDLQNKEKEVGVKAATVMEEDGFQLVYGKKKKPGVNVKSELGNGSGGEESVVLVASRDPKTAGTRAKVPFHIPTIRRPQDEYGILANNSNLPFEHVWLQKSEDGCRFIHPLEKLSVEDFIDRRASDTDPIRPPSIESTPFKLVEEVKELKELAKKLRDAEEFSVDLEHNHYRSFQGITCLMQISTRTEDFVVDTLRLRVHVGPYLREVFKDPSKRKVMHGADRDIVWLQRDFGIYVCNLFDTGQASRLLELERNSLEYLLQHFCGVTANKEYQNADWRFRPLSDDMIKYAREDTHYLLYIYDLMRARLLSLSQAGDDLLLEVYNRSSAICTKLYEKELLTDTSYLYIYGLNGVDFNAEQLAVVAGLCAWRDSVARAEDESTGYILPNKALLEIARQMPNTAGKLKRLVKSKHPFVERNLNVVVSIIRSSIANAAAFEDVAEQLKKEREEMVPEEGQVASDPISMDICPQLETIQQNTGSVKPFEQFNSAQSSSASPKTSSSIHPGQNGAYSESDTCPSIKPAAVVSVQVLKKPGRAFGAMLGSSSSKRKHEHDKTASKLEQIKSSVTLPFHSFSGVPETSRTVSVVSNTASDRASMSREAVGPASDQVFSVEGDIPLQSDKNTVFLESIDPQFGESVVAEAARDSDFIPLEVDLVDQTGKLADGSITEDTMKQKGNSDGNDDLELEPSPAYENPLAELSSSLQEYCRTVIRTEERSSEGSNDIGEPLDKLQKQMKLTEDDSKTNNGDKLSSTSLESNRVDKVFSLPRMPGEGTRDSSLEPRRSQAFPASGNRSMTFTQ